MRNWRCFFCLFLLTACSGGGDSAGSEAGFSSECDGSCATATTKLSQQDVTKVVNQAILQAQALGEEATIAVVDRVGNVLAVYRMGDAAERVVQLATELDASGEPLISGGLEGIRLPTVGVPLNIDGIAAISKALTGAYLSSEGNAFSTRTASQIVQENFNPGELNQAAGPLFGVQFSQLSCSDFSHDASSISFGPKRSPLGLAADPGGFPLYKEGTPVGGVGVIADGHYSLDKIISDKDQNIDEIIALAATVGFEAPINRRANRITVEGKTFRYSDVNYSDLAETTVPSGLITDPLVGELIAVEGYTDGLLYSGRVFGQVESGIRQDTVNFPADLDAFIFVDSGTNLNRFPVRAGTDGLLAANEVQVLLEQALTVANKTRAQIRQPLSSQARVSISIVDTNGEILAMGRTRDAPVFGSDVSLQKARTAAFFSSSSAADFLGNQPDAVYFTISESSFDLTEQNRIPILSYLERLRIFLNDDTALSTGEYAFSDRAGGNLSRPFFPDGILGEPSGPLSKEQGQWSVFSTGLQLDLIFNGVIQHVLYVASDGLIPDLQNQCTGVGFTPESLSFSSAVPSQRLANGSQIFPGSVPIYRDRTLIGGIGVSGDGVDQDDMIAFLAVHNASLALSGSINNAPEDMRADQLQPLGVRLRYIQCPQAPFLSDSTENVCEGK